MEISEMIGTQTKANKPEQQRSDKAAEPRRPSSTSSTGWKAAVLDLQAKAGNQAVSRSIANNQFDRLPLAAISYNGRNLPPLVDSVLNSGGGRALDPTTRETMESRLGYDFSQVRIHAGSRAAESAASLGARAYTVGPNIVFSGGRYRPYTSTGQQLLSHELTHVIQQARSSSVGPTAGQYRAAEQEARGVANGAAGWSQSAPSPTPVTQGVQAGTIQGDGVGEWIVGAIGGEFIDDPTYGQIGVDFILSVIPYVDQVADARDLIAHIWRLGFRGEYTNWLRWVGLVFTLIGLFPEIGSAIKSLSKTVVRAGRQVFRHLDDILHLARRLLPGNVNPGRIRRFFQRNWPTWARRGRAIWDSILARGGELVGRMLERAGGFLNRITSAAGSLRQALTSRLTRLRELSGSWLPRAFEDVRRRVMAAMDDISERMGRRSAPTSGPSVPDSPRRIESTGSVGSGSPSSHHGPSTSSGESGVSGRHPDIGSGAETGGRRGKRGGEGGDAGPTQQGAPRSLPGATGTRHLPREFKMPRQGNTSFPSSRVQIGTAEQRAAGRVRGRGQRVRRGEVGTQATSVPRGRSGARDHFREHGAEFPEYPNARAYEQGAIDFCRDSSTRRFYYRHQGGRPTIGYYNIETNTFAATSVDGRTIYTHFRPENVEKYVRNIRTGGVAPGTLPRHSVPVRRGQ